MIATIKGERVYGLDFYFYKMDLKGIPFEVEIEKDVTTLRAPYFGMSDKYGNGAIRIRNSMYKPEDIEPYDTLQDDEKYASLFNSIFGKFPIQYTEIQKKKSKCDTCVLEHCSYEPNSTECQSAFKEDKCEFCTNHSEDDCLYEEAGWEHGYCFDEVRIKYCPVCGRKLEK